MRHLLTFVSLLFVGSVWAEDFNFNSPKAKAAMEKYQYDKEDLLRDLEAALKHERNKGSLEEAIKIRDAIATLKQQPDAPVSNAHIPADAVEWNGHYYWISNRAINWHDAKAKCEKMGGHLVRIESEPEHDFIKNIVDRNRTETSHYWADGSDEASEGKWKFSNGSPVPYNGWGGGEPNGGRRCNYKTIWKPSGWGFADDVSIESFSYICEWDGPAGSTQRAKKIPADAVKYKGNYYKVFHERQTHGGASTICKILGGHLARIENSSELRFVTNLWDNAEPHWIDGSDKQKEGVWRYGDGTLMTYFNWEPPEPNNLNNEDFLVNYGHNGMWNDAPFAGYQNNPYGFICEWEGAGQVLESTKPDGKGLWKQRDQLHAHISGKTFDTPRGKITLNADGSVSINGGGWGEWMPMNNYDCYLRLEGNKVVIINCLDLLRHPEQNANRLPRFRFFGLGNLYGGQAINPVAKVLERSTEHNFNERKSNRSETRRDKKGNLIGTDSSPVKKISSNAAKRVLDDANLWEGKPGVWFLKQANNFTTRSYELLSRDRKIRSALRAVNGRLPTSGEMKNPPVRR